VRIYILLTANVCCYILQELLSLWSGWNWCLSANVDMEIMDSSLLLCFSCYSKNNNYVDIIIVMRCVRVCVGVLYCTPYIDHHGDLLLLLVLPCLFLWECAQLCFQAGGRNKRPNLAFKMFQFILSYSIFVFLMHGYFAL